MAEGEEPVCLIAHLDTVGEHPPVEIYYDQKQKVMWSPDLLGADDRAGVYAIIQILEAGYRPHIIFTTNEEIGAIGATALVKQFPECPLENLKAIFQLDRRGKEDCVFYNCDNRDFENYVKSFGFKKAYGSFSDISVIAPAWGVAAVNLSIGYEREHTNMETLYIKDMELTIERVKEILDDANNMLSYAYIPVKIKHIRSYGRCVFCATPLSTIDDHVTVEEAGYNYAICNPCYSAYYLNNLY